MRLLLSIPALLALVSVAHAVPCYSSKEAVWEAAHAKVHVSWTDRQASYRLYYKGHPIAHVKCEIQEARKPLPKPRPVHEASRPSAPTPAAPKGGDTLRASERGVIDMIPAPAADPAVPLPSAEALWFAVNAIAATDGHSRLTTGAAPKLPSKLKKGSSSWVLYFLAAVIGVLTLGFLGARALRPRQTKRVPELPWQKQVQLAYAAEGIEKPWHRPLKQAA